MMTVCYIGTISSNTTEKTFFSKNMSVFNCLTCLYYNIWQNVTKPPPPHYNTDLMIVHGARLECSAANELLKGPGVRASELLRGAIESEPRAQERQMIITQSRHVTDPQRPSEMLRWQAEGEKARSHSDICPLCSLIFNHRRGSLHLFLWTVRSLWDSARCRPRSLQT